MVKFDSDTHTYTTEDGTVLLSVTQLLKIQGLSPDFSGVPEDVLRRAADRGTAIHAEFESLINNNGDAIVFSDEASWFRDSFYDPDDKWFSEVMVWTEGLPTDYAGTIDIIRVKPDGKVQIYDIKTGQVHLDSVAWQLSLYRHAYALQNRLDAAGMELFCIDAKPDHCDVIPIHPVSDAEILNLLEAQANEMPYSSNDPVLSQTNLAKIESFETAIAELDKAKADIERNYAEFQSSLMDAMLDNGVKTFETPKYKVTFVASTVSKTFDSGRFKTDHADLYEEYKTKTVSKKAYLKVTAK